MRNPKIRVEIGDAYDALVKLPKRHFHCIMTSPPAWDGTGKAYVKGEIGRESDWDCYLGNLMDIFNEVRRVLRPDGVMFVHLIEAYFDHSLELRPAAVAQALKEEGWYVRSEIPAMPDEKIFLFSRIKTHFYDAAAVTVPQMMKGRPTWMHPMEREEKPYLAHCPESLLANCLFVGTSERGCCEDCGAPDQRDKEGKWLSGCSCGLDSVPCRVLDPFYGSGTTGIVAAKLGLDCYGIEINPRWVSMGKDRLDGEVGMFVDYKKKEEAE